MEAGLELSGAPLGRNIVMMLKTSPMNMSNEYQDSCFLEIVSTEKREFQLGRALCRLDLSLEQGLDQTEVLASDFSGFCWMRVVVPGNRE